MKLKIFAFFVLLLGWKSTLFAQNGEVLFKKCFTCHSLGKNSTGPDLIGARAKWDAAGEGELLYQWVNNSEALIASGKSQMANAIKDFSPTTMEAIPMSKEDIDAVFDYIDNWTPPVAAVSDGDAQSSDGSQVVIVKPNYKRNLNFFYALCTVTIVSLLAILLLSFSIQTLVRSEYFKDKLKKTGEDILNAGAKLLVIGLFLFNGISANAFSLRGPSDGLDGNPWLLIENSDLWILLIINIVLLGLVWYLRGLFMNFLRMVRPKPIKVVKVSAAKKWNKILTDVVDIEDEHEILIDHEYDGIQELDNNLPPWWLWMFYLSILFGVVYLFHYHVFKTGDSQVQEYESVMISKQAEVEEYLKAMAMNVDENSAVLLDDDNELKAGKVVFEENCVVCHLSDGSGKIGPNLTDKYWIYGFDVKDVFGVIKYGTDNGMPEHASKLKPTQIQQVASYILHFEPVEGGAAAQGDIVKPD